MIHRITRKIDMCKYYNFLFLFVLSVTSCSNDEASPSCKLLSSSTKPLYYDELPAVINYNPNFSGKINFEYDANGRMIKILGGPMRTGSNYNTFMFYDEIEHDITYVGDTIRVESFLNSPNGYTKYILEDDKIAYRSYLPYGPSTIPHYTYEYEGDTVLELQNGVTLRTFYRENNNLIKIEEIRRTDAGQIFLKKDVLFSEYDSSLNLLKGKFFINGAFYAAFSNNNFKRVDIKIYEYVDEQYVLLSENFYTFGYSIGENNIPDLFEQECD